jgi:ParB family chromosome partitioning protein
MSLPSVRPAAYRSSGVTDPNPVRVVALSLIDRAADNPRRKLSDIDELAASIAEQGLLQPLVVAAVAEGRYLLIAGHRRFAALARLGRDAAPCVVLSEMGDARRLSAMLTENDQRVSLTPMERAEAYQRLIEEFGLNQSEVARLVGKHASQVNKDLQLLKPVDVRVREIDDYRSRRAMGVPQRGRPPADATVAATMNVLRRLAEHGVGELTPAQAAVALRVIEQGALALTRERAREGRLSGVA